MTHFNELKITQNLKIVSKILMFVNKTMPNNLILMHYSKRELVFNKFFLLELVRYSADRLVTKTFLTSSSDWSKFDLVNNSISTTDTTESKDRTTSCIVRTRTDPSFWTFFVRTYRPTPTLPFNNNACFFNADDKEKDKDKKIETNPVHNSLIQ